VRINEPDKARDWARRALAIDPDDIMTKYNIACYKVEIGEHDEAMELILEYARQVHVQIKQWFLQDSDLVPLHRHPRWAEAVALANIG
jgi:adenylate cyclase